METEEPRIVYFTKHLILAYYFTNTLQGALLHNFRDIIVGRVGPFKPLEDIFSYTGKELVGKHIPPKEIPLGTREPLKEAKRMLEYDNEKQVHTSTREPLKNKDIPKKK